MESELRRKESLETNCGVEESPVGDTCSLGDRVGEPVDVKPTKIPATTETHEEGGRTFVQLCEYSDQLLVDI